MEKVFEALKRIETTFSMNKEGKESVYREYTNSIYPYYEDFDLVLNALTELQAIKESKLSEALEELKTFNYIMTRCKDEDSYIIKFPLGVQKGTTFGEEMEKAYKVIHQTLLKAQDDNRFIELILNKPQLLGVFAFDGVHTWEEFEDTYSDEDKEYINTTKEEFEYMRNQLIKRGKIDD